MNAVSATTPETDVEHYVYSADGQELEAILVGAMLDRAIGFGSVVLDELIGRYVLTAYGERLLAD